LYIHRTRLTPALGKAPEAKTLVADHVRHLQRQGQRLALSERILSSEPPTLIVSHLADDLAEIEAVRRARLTDEDFRTRAARTAALLSEPPRSTLWEGIVDPQVGPPPTAIGQLAFIFPATGKDSQVVAIASEFVGELRKLGQRASLLRQIYSSDGSRLQIMIRYADLAELDRARKARSEIAQRATAAVAEITRAPIEQRLTETIVALPA
jgi:hypothetical protein